MRLLVSQDSEERISEVFNVPRGTSFKKRTNERCYIGYKGFFIICAFLRGYALSVLFVFLNNVKEEGLEPRGGKKRKEKVAGGKFFSFLVRRRVPNAKALGRQAGQIAAGKVRPATGTKISS